MATRYAAQKAAYRARARARGVKPPGAFDKAVFIAIDGEGFNSDETATVRIGAPARDLTARVHHYGYLAASDGSELYADEGRLHGKDCLDFLLDVKAREPDAVLVCFGASYDMTHMLAHVLSYDEIDWLLHGDGSASSRRQLDVTLEKDGVAHDYRLEFRPRKQLTITRWRQGADKYEEHTKRNGETVWRLSQRERVVLWDVWGFFQGNFIGAMKTWLPNDPDWHFIRDWKGRRSGFNRDEMDTIRRYNAAELRCLVAMMERVREACRALGLTIQRWDGAGAIAGAMMKAHDVKDHMAETPPDVFEASRVAYSGGHIEAVKVGHHAGAVHHYDVNSAYPDKFRRLPSLAIGAWSKGQGTPPDGFTLVHVAFRFLPGMPFYPLFHRGDDGAILYPERGAGWYWYPEYSAARAFAEQHGAFDFHVLGWHHFSGQANESPFRWIEDYYARRQSLVAETKQTGVPNGEEKAIKLGLNSCYGKTAQQVGARIVDGELKGPAYFQLEWAGYVTSATRAQLMLAAIQKPHAIISFATDGLFSTEPLDLDCPTEKRLGAWEYQCHTGITIVMPGVYWLHDDAVVTHHSRGFNKEEMKDHEIVLEAWRAGDDVMAFHHERMVTLGAALMSDALWELRGCFVTAPRMLRMNGHNSKRIAMNASARPHRGLVALAPRDLVADYDVNPANLMSAPYEIEWMKTDDEEPMDAAGVSAFLINSHDLIESAFLA